MVGRAVQLGTVGLIAGLAVVAAQRIRQRVLAGAGRVQRNRVAQRFDRQLVEQLADVDAVRDTEVVGQRGVDRAGQIGAGPGRLALLDVGESGLDHVLRRPRLRGGRLLASRERRMGNSGEAAVDVGAQLRIDTVEDLLAGLAVVRLGPPGGEGGLPGQPIPHSAVRGPTGVRLIGVDQLLGLRGHRTTAYAAKDVP